MAAIGIPLERYRPLVIEKLTQVLGAPVEIDSVSLVLRDGFALRLKNIRVYMNSKKEAALVKADQANLYPKFGPLFQKEWVMSVLKINKVESHYLNASAVKIRVLQTGSSNEWIVHADTVSLNQIRKQLSLLRSVRLRIAPAGEDLLVKKFTCGFLKGALKASGVIREYRTKWVTDFNSSCFGLDIRDVARGEGSEDGPQFSGLLSASLRGRFRGFTEREIFDSFKANGKVILKHGVLMHYNVFRRLLQRFSAIPGAEEAIQTSLPGSYRLKMEEENTFLRPVIALIRVGDRKVITDKLILKSDSLEMRGDAAVDFQKSLFARTFLRMNKDVSLMLASILPKFKLLFNGAQQIEIPVQLRGRLPKIAIFPDTGTIRQRLLAYQAQEAITNFLDNPVTAGEAGVKNSVKGLLAIVSDKPISQAGGQ